MEDISIPQRLVNVLACPACDTRPKVELVPDGVHCPMCGRIYPVEHGVPIMLVDRAKQTDAEGDAK